MMAQSRYLTKYALTSGVQIITGEPCNGTFYPHGWIGTFSEEKDCCETRAEAIARIMEMRDKRIITLRKSIEKLQKLNAESLVMAAGEEQ